MAMYSPKDGKFRCVIPIEATYTTKFKRIEVWVDHVKVTQALNTDGVCIMYQALAGKHLIEVVTVDSAGKVVKEKRNIEVV